MEAIRRTAYPGKERPSKEFDILIARGMDWMYLKRKIIKIKTITTSIMLSIFVFILAILYAPPNGLFSGLGVLAPNEFYTRSNLDFRAAYHLGVAKSAAIWVGPPVIYQNQPS